MNEHFHPNTELQQLDHLHAPPSLLTQDRANRSHNNSRGHNNSQPQLLNDSLRSFHSSISEEGSSIHSGTEELDLSSDNDNQPLLPYPNPNIGGLYSALYDYIRFGVSLYLFLYCLGLIFFSKNWCSRSGSTSNAVNAATKQKSNFGLTK